jgi:hypothetical protein
METAQIVFKPLVKDVSAGYVKVPAGTKVRVRKNRRTKDVVQQRTTYVTTRSVEYFASGRIGVSWKRNGYKASTIVE